MRKRSKTWQIALRILCAMLLLFASVAHKAMGFAEASPTQLSAYVLPDGSVPSLCISDKGTTKPAKHFEHHCQGCRTSSGIIRPPAANEAETIVRIDTRTVFFAWIKPFRRLLFPPNAPPRGPPDHS